jgi:general secretion pathway protein E/type IV pilus assembly protein PilB
LTSNDEYVLQILQENSLVGSDQVDHARNMTMNDPSLSIVDALLDSGAISEEDVLCTLGEQFGMKVVSLKDFEIKQDIVDLITSETAHSSHIIPLYEDENNNLVVGISDPLDYASLDNLRYKLKREVEAVLAVRKDLQELIERYYQMDSTMDTLLDQVSEVEDGAVSISSDANSILDDGSSSETDAPIIKLCSLIIMEGYKNSASDIHLEPLEKRFRVRYRIDGVLHEVDSPPKRLQSAIISRMKIMAHMKISEKRTPQDGRIQVDIGGRELDLRVSTIPTEHGESIVMRILDKQNLALGLPQLGFFADDQKTFDNLINLSDGIILVTGPTGSGKTTTLYACLGQINKPDRKIITVEDPVEYQMSGINQVQVQRDIDFTFSAALRSILRQAPNIVMIGEIRDAETAGIATEAALTGHLVFSTLHTNDAPSAVTRLLDIGVKPFLVASSVRAIMAQRLVRNICPQCKEELVPSQSDLSFLGGLGTSLADSPIYKGRGCSKCSLTGYKGRKGLFEIFKITDEVQHLIFNKESAIELRAKARENGMRTLREDGVRKVLAGITTVEEVMRVTMGDLN